MKASDFAGLVPECCSDVLETMYFSSIFASCRQDALPGDAPENFLPNEFAFGLRFTGNISGRFGVHLDSVIARCLAANFLGEDDATLSSQDVREVVGELANMLCGAVVSRIEADCKFVLSHPEPLAALPIAGGEDALITRLDTDSGVITTWIVVEGLPCNP
jgi:hypothetical protein